ncbi:hypothetical protein RYX36_031850 [Vicia faba]
MANLETRLLNWSRNIRRELIKLPRFNKKYEVEFAAFSCSPTASGCVILVVQCVSSTVGAISTCYPEANKWTTNNYRNCSLFFPLASVL